MDEFWNGDALREQEYVLFDAGDVDAAQSIDIGLHVNHVGGSPLEVFEQTRRVPRACQ